MKFSKNDRKFLRDNRIEPDDGMLTYNDLMRLLDDQIGATARAEEDRARWRTKYQRLRASVIWMAAVAIWAVWLCVMVGWPR